MSSVQPSDILSVIGVFLTLVGLLGSFFFVHLSDWYRKILSLSTKWDINKYGDDPDQKASRRECRYEVEELASWTTLITSLVVTSFVLLVFWFSLALWRSVPAKNDAWIYIGAAGVVFLLIYIGMTIGLLGMGYRKIIKIRREITSKNT